MESVDTKIEKLLIDWNKGDQDAFEKLLPHVEMELQRIADRTIRKFPLNNTLEKESLINETYLKLLDQNKTDWKNIAQFYEFASLLMRQILLTYIRDQAKEKRGGGVQVALEDPLILKEALALKWERAHEFLLLDDALNRLAKFDERKAKIIELRFFAGLDVSETAEVLNVSTSTVARDYVMAKAWLARELKNDDVITNNQASRNEYPFLRRPNFSEAELQGEFQPNRRPWRAMFRVTRVKDENLWVVLPGWDSDREIQINKNALPKKLHPFLSTGERFFAKVNIGADDQSELYFTEFEERP